MSCAVLDQLEEPYMAIRSERTRAALQGTLTPELDERLCELEDSARFDIMTHIAEHTNCDPN